MKIKIRMCGQLGIRPLFIMRWAPKSYVEFIRQAGGFGLLFETQFLPPGQTVAMNGLRELMLPVSGASAVPDGTFKRFVKYGHNAQVER
jgi:hypothetical protein